MKITQCYTALRFFQKDIFKKYQLTQYWDVTKPVVFWGLYKQHFKFIDSHKSFMLIVWCGGDILQMLKRPDIITKLKSRPDIRHIAQSSFIEKGLDSVGIPYVSIPIVEPDVSIIKPEPLGNSIYTYIARGRPSVYGRDTVRVVQGECPEIKFHICHKNKYNRGELMDIYKDCFMGLRLTWHDGFSNTVAELGLMGRRVVWNGRAPNAIPYDTVNDIAQSVKNEYANRLNADYNKVAKEMSDYLNTPNFLNTKFYE